ncbi:ABC transporter ATP-binding protein [Candidatus Acetothermia bacterium]|jgi:ABC-type polysaccharide/polyol phosphate transport system ATPase subunit|nr:ABC transporter ATP-binding protein [Candidatus Acetothermia bacterium]
MRLDRPGFKEFIISAPKFLKNDKNRFWALKGVSFSVNKGECLGIIGRNGAGKSTLLSLLLGVAQPTKGSVEVNGKKTPLLELGAGFHPDLTGTETIIINGVLLGHTEKEIRARMAAIIAFSELGEFIKMPIRVYSSGMQMRLAFSIAIHTSPEILLIDEILAVGDESFQRKSGEPLLNLIKSGITTVYVSHNMEAIKKICDRVIWLEQGEIKAEGEAGLVVEEYLKAQGQT